MRRSRLLSPLSPGGCLLAALLFVLVTILTSAGAFRTFDGLATELRLRLPAWAAASLGLPFAVAGSVEVTAAVLALLVLALWRRNRRLALAAVAAFLLASLVEVALKVSLSHPNPPLLHHLAGPALPEARLLRLIAAGPGPWLPPALLLNSYPSGHMARVLFLLLLLCSFRPDRAIQRAAVAFAVALAAALVLAGAHWPSDVLGGVLLAWSCAAAARMASTERCGLRTERGMTESAALSPQSSSD